MSTVLTSTGPTLSAHARRAAARVWAIRERTEHEVSAIFARLGADLARSGAPAELQRRARQCAADEEVHAVHCRHIVDALEPRLPPLVPNLEIRLGATGATPAMRALYASVALGCVTESFSAALLLEMRSCAGAEVVKTGLDRILTDEVQHSRLGWAHLAFESGRGDVSWLSAQIPAMLDAAMRSEPATDVDGIALDDADRAALRSWGILPPDEVAAIAERARKEVIEPGLRQFGIRC